MSQHWTFRSRAVAKHFDQHVREQLPWYDLATNAVAHFGRHYIPRGGPVYDIGASTGNIGLASRKPSTNGKRASPPSRKAGRWPTATRDRPTCVADAVTFDYQPFDFAVCFLVLMFLPVDTRPLPAPAPVPDQARGRARHRGQGPDARRATSAPPSAG